MSNTPIRVSHGPSPIEPDLWLVTEEWEDDIDSNPGSVEDARALAERFGLATEVATPDGVTTWTD